MLLWAAEGSLGAEGRATIDAADSAVVSAASMWEIEIKRARGRLIAPSDLGERALREGFEPLPISFEHAVTAGRLEPFHRDPFDRMLVAQAKVEGLSLMTADPALAAYDVPLAPVARERS